METVTKEDVAGWFSEDVQVLDGAKILYAEYQQECYEGSARVIFEKDNKLYEVHGSHCSCYGLENQWEPEETFVEAILKQYWVTPEIAEILNKWKKNVARRKVKK